MCRLKLVEPAEIHEEAVMNFRKKFDGRISGSIGLEDADSYEKWLNHEYVPHYGKVKERVYLAINENKKIVGIADIRLESNDFIRNFAGQIGYSVAPEERGKGYATEILKLILSKAKELGFTKVLVTCNVSNTASAKVIEKNGGILEKIVPHPGFPDVRRYYFDL